MPTDSLKSRYDNAILVRIPLLVTHMTLYLLNFLMCSIYNEYKPMLKLADLRKCESCVRVCVCVWGGGGGRKMGGGGGTDHTEPWGWREKGQLGRTIRDRTFKDRHLEVYIDSMVTFTKCCQTMPPNHMLFFFQT